MARPGLEPLDQHRGTPGSHSARVLSILRSEGPLSRARLAEITGLSPTTITKAVAPLTERGLLREEVEVSSRVGRPSIQLVPVPEGTSACGIQISYGIYQIGMADASGRPRHVSSSRFDPTTPAEVVLDRIAAEAVALIAADGGAPCIGVGVGGPGPVADDLRKLHLAPSLGWSDVAVADTMERTIGLPVVVDHNVRSMALAELRYGGYAASSVAYLLMHSGIALGTAVDRLPFYGVPGGESYIGHTRVVDGGEVCTCGARGCLTTVVAEPYLARAVQAVLPAEAQHHPQGILHTLEREAIRGNGGAERLREQFIGHIAQALAYTANIFTPELILVGGHLGHAPRSLIDDLTARTRDQIFVMLRDQFRLEQADSSDAALVRAGASVALEALHYG